MKLRLSSDFAVDTDQYKREGLRISILAMSGHGKSNAAADVVEDVLDNGAQVIIIEPIPEWHTLKARYSNVVVIGGPYQDLPLEQGFAHEYVKTALEKGISLVVNVSDLEDEADQVKFVSSFLWNLYRLEQKYRRVLFLVLEEADVWAPQQWDAVTKQSLSRVSLIAKHGRKIGIFPILISQRPADLHKSPLSQCNVNLFGKFTSPADLSEKTGIMYVVKKQHLEITEQQIMTLETGRFIITDKNGVHTVAVRKRLCPHGADTPLVEAKPFTADLSNALSGLREEITKALEAKKDEDSALKRLEKENEALRRSNKELEAKANIKLSVKEMMEGSSAPASVNASMVPSVDKAELEKLQKEVDALRIEVEEFRSGRKLAESVQGRLKVLGEVKHDLEEKLNEKDRELQDFASLKAIFGKMFSPVLTDEQVATLVEPQANKMLKKFEEIAVREMAKIAGVQDGAAAVVVTESVPEIHHRIEHPVVETDETTREGQMLTLACHGFFDQKRRLTEVGKEMQRVYLFTAGNAARDLTPILGRLISLKILQREEAPGGGWLYWLTDGAKDRIKEAS